MKRRDSIRGMGGDAMTSVFRTFEVPRRAPVVRSAGECSRCLELRDTLQSGASATCDECGGVLTKRTRAKSGKPVRYGTRYFRELEERTLRDMRAIAAFEGTLGARSSWTIASPATSQEADVVARKVGLLVARPRERSDVDAEAQRDLGRRLSCALSTIAQLTDASPLVWLTRCGGLIASSSKQLVEAIGWGLATKKQRAAWLAAGDATGRAIELGRAVWPRAVVLWCGEIMSA